MDRPDRCQEGEGLLVLAENCFGQKTERAVKDGCDESDVPAHSAQEDMACMKYIEQK